MEKITGVKAELFRFPGGSINVYNATIYQEIIAEMTRRGFVYYDWNMSCEDASKIPLSVGEILQSATNLPQSNRVILLMHDSNHNINTANALQLIIDHYIKDGYTVQPLTKDVKPIIFGYNDK